MRLGKSDHAFLMDRDLGGVRVGRHNLAAAAISRKARQELAIGGEEYMEGLEDWLAMTACRSIGRAKGLSRQIA